MAAPMSIMNSAVLGMSAQEGWLATISQNMANSSATGYKDAETEFSALVDQVGASASPGTGVSTSSLTLAGLQGSIVGTSTPTDLAIQGNGFFVVSDAAGDTFLTRDGSFVPDASGNLVNAAGYYLMGADVQNGASSAGADSLSGLVKVNVDPTAANGDASGAVTGVNVGAYGTLSFIYSNGTTAPAYSIPLADVASPNSLTAINGTVFSANANSGLPQLGAAGAAGLGTINSSSLESSTVDIATELTAMIQAQSSYEFNSKVFQTGSTVISDLNNLGG
jgi:flagellar hook protein FlgE